MKKFLFIMLAALIAFSCQKNDGPTVPQEVDVEFSITQTGFDGLKSTNDDVPLCVDDTWSYVVFEIYAEEELINLVGTYTSPVIFMPGAGGDILTKAIKLAPGTYYVGKFLVYNAADQIVRAAPEPGSLYHSLMENPLNLAFTVSDFVKKQIIIDVLCFEDLFYDAFGFTWFELNDVKIERQCFFGDVCTGKLADFEGSLYAQQSQGIQMDMPAIMKIEVRKKVGGEWPVEADNVFTNETWTTPDYPGPGEGDCLEVFWANDLDLTEEFQFKLFVLLPYGDDFEYKLIDVFEFFDENCPNSNQAQLPEDDGVVDFVLGNCQIPSADFVYPAWMNLPDFDITFTMRLVAYNPGAEGTYVDAIFSGLPDGFDIPVGPRVGVWCGNKDLDIYLNTNYTVQAFSFIQPLPPGVTSIDVTKMNYLNWLWNNLQTYFPGIDPFDFTAFTAGFDNDDWAQIQNAVWNITDNTGYGGQAQTMSTAAVTNPLFQPLPGQWAGVGLYVNNTTQLLFIQLDP